MRKILFFPHTFSAGGGAERVLNTLINELVKWYDIDVIERWEYSTYIYDLPENARRLKSMTYSPQMVKEKGWSELYWMFHRKMLSVLMFFFPSLIYRYYIKGKYDYEISFNYQFPSLIIGYSPNRESKKIMWVHTDIYNIDYLHVPFKNKLIAYIKYSIQKRAFKKADKIVAISNNTYQSIIDLFPFTQNKLCIIYNGYDFDNFKFKAKEFKIEQSERFRLLFMGRLEKRKNVITAVKAVNHLLNKSVLDIELIILGDGECRKEAEREAKKHPDHFQFLGFQSNPYPYVKSSNALLVTSITEGFPTIIIESISLGVPVITTRVGGVDEIIVEGVNGMVVENDIEDIADKIYYMKKNQSQFLNNIEDTIKNYSAHNWGENVKKNLDSFE